MVEGKNNKQKNRTKYFLPGGKKQIQAVCAFLFLGVLILSCGVNLMHKDRQMSEKEMRMLAQKPEISLSGIASGRFMEQYFFCIDQVIRISKFCLYTADLSALTGSHRKCRKLVLHNICRIRNQHHMHLDIRITLFKILHCIQILFQITFICHSNIFHQIMILSFENTTFFCPPRHTVRKCLDSYDWIDAEKVLDAHKDEAIYYHTDHHWTSLGAWYAFQGAKTQLGLDKSEEIKMKAYAVSDSFNGTLSAKSGYETDYKEPIYIYLPKSADAPQVAVNYVEEQKKSASMYDSSKLDERDQYSVFFGGNHAMIDIQSTQTEKRRLLVFKDSYANCFLPLLAPYYREIVVIDPRYYTGKLSSVMSDKQFDDVLFLYNANTFFEDRMMAGVLDEN